MLNILKKISVIACSLMILLSTVAFAYSKGDVLMSYDGQGIRGKESIGGWGFTNAGNSIRIHHNTTAWYDGSDAQQNMKVSVKKKSWNGLYYCYGNCNVNFNGVGSFTKDFWINDKGSFDLYFEATEGASCADIYGNVTLN